MNSERSEPRSPEVETTPSERSEGAQPDLSDWHSKAEAARILNCSEKHIEKLVKLGEIEQRFRKAIGQARISVFHPGDVQKALAKRTPAFRVENVAMALSERSEVGRPRDDFFAGLAEALARIAGVAEALNERYAPNTAIYVSLDEALRITGLSAETVRGLARAGRIARLSRKYRRKDLEAL